MSTYNIEVNTATWTKVVDGNDTDFLITWDAPKTVEFASTELDEAPTIRGHRFPRERAITREDVGADFIWAKLVSDGAGNTCQLSVSKTKSISGAIGGFDSNENIQKTGMLVWNPSTLAWERFTGVTGGEGGGGGSSSPMTKRIDKASETVTYVGEAVAGTLESASNWAIKKITFDVNGNATAVLYGTGSWVSRNTHSYQ